MKTMSILATILAAAALAVACVALVRAERANRHADGFGDALEDTIRAVRLMRR